ncbi:MAG: DUF4190 domain-containing protein, partial [Pyrinomonadaceae bacterium]
IEIAPEEPAVEAAPEPEDVEAAVEEPVIHQTIGSMPIAPPEDVLDLPSNDPLKTMYVSETEMQAALGTTEPDIVEIPAIDETPAPEPPSFLTPEPPPTPFDAPPPSPFAAPEEPMSSPSSYEEPAYDEAATMIQPTFEPPPFEPSTPAFDAVPSAFDTPTAAPVAEWTPPPAPDAGWANQEIGSNTPFQPPPAGVAGGENKTLAIVSLVLGIVSLCCYVSPLTGLGALITGFMAMKNVNNDPAQYGGKGLAIAGMVTGGLFFLIGLAYWIFILFFGGLAMMMDAAR